MPLITQKVNLKDSFQYTNLDLEDSGPINVSNYNHSQQWVPSSGYSTSPQGQKQGGALKQNGFNGPEGLDLENNGPINASNYNHSQQWIPSSGYSTSPQGQKQGGVLKQNGFNGPDGLDLENNGPINASNYNHSQQWTPSNRYVNNPQGQKRGGILQFDGFNGVEELDLENNGPKSTPTYTQQWTPSDGYAGSPQGQVRSNNSPAQQNNFKTSALDLENTEAGVRQGGNGGPINWSYTSKIGSEIKSFPTTQPYVPKSTYIDSLQAKDLATNLNLNDQFR